MKSGLKVIVIVVLAASITLAHYIVDPHAGSIHDILQRVYYVPIVLAGIWFGVRGGLITAFLVTVAYLPHARHGWYGPYTFIFQASEMTMYHIIGGLCGYLSSKERRALTLERLARTAKEQAYEAERKSREEREAALQSLQEKTRELFTMEEQLRRSDRLAALGKLSAGLAHEIRNPLGSIKTSAEMLVECTCNVDPGALEEKPNFVGIIQQEVIRLDRILTDFILFAKASENSGQHLPAMEARCNPLDALTRTTNLLKPELDRQKITLDVHGKRGLGACTVAIGANPLQQVFLNLLLNAMQAIKDDGIITVEFSIENDTLKIAVSDSGPGVLPDHAGTIFDPFVSFKAEGSGLGLSVIERILAGRGGSIILDLSHEPLNRFYVALPLAD